MFSVDLKFLKGLTGRYLAGLPTSANPPDRLLGFAMTLASDREGQDVIAALRKMGFTKLQLDHVRMLIRKRWRVSGLSAPVRCLEPDVHKWLDTMDTFARTHGGALETWFPTALPGEDL